MMDMKKYNAWSNEVEYQAKHRAQNYIVSTEKSFNTFVDRQLVKVSLPCTGACGCGPSCSD